MNYGIGLFIVYIKGIVKYKAEVNNIDEIENILKLENTLKSFKNGRKLKQENFVIDNTG